MRVREYPLSACGRVLRAEGRITINEEGVLMDWSACGFTVNFCGSGIVLRFAGFHEMQPIMALTVLDGVRAKHAVADGSENVVLECGDGLHTLTFLRLSEGGVPLIATDICVSALRTESAPRLLDGPEAPARKLLFFGDSITCGYGNCGDPSLAGFRTEEEDPTRAYAYRAAAMLGASAELVSISGQGIVRDCSGSVGTPIPVFCRWQSRTLRTPSESGEPDAIVINAGTNDAGGGVTQAEFRDGAEAFLRALRTEYPKTPIVWFYGLMGLTYDRTLRELIDALRPELGCLLYLPTAPIYERAGEVGANGHPSVEGDERAACELASALAGLLNW